MFSFLCACCDFALYTILFCILLYYGYNYMYPGVILDSKDKVILISGCDSGFGKLLTIQLDKLNYTVLSGCYTDNGINYLKSECSSNVEPFKLDITDQKSMENTVKLVQDYEAKGKKLWALVNNAGIGEGSRVDWTNIDVDKKVMETNYFGHIYMTKLFYGNLIASKGRIINITSVAGFLAAPGLSSYSASKHALEGFSAALRREISIFGCKVIIISPSFMKTNIIQGVQDHQEILWKKLSTEVQNRYGEIYKDALIQANIQRINEGVEDPSAAINDLVHSITNSKPKLRYLPGKSAKLYYFLAAVLPVVVVDFILSHAKVKPAFVTRNN